MPLATVAATMACPEDGGLLTSLALATLLLLQWWWMRRQPLSSAAQAIFDAVADLPCAAGPPSRRTRSSAQDGSTGCDEKQLLRRERERKRVRHFARAVRSLPLRDGGAIHCVPARTGLQIPQVSWTPHGSNEAALEDCDPGEGLLPRLQSVKDDAAAQLQHPWYAEQLPQRRRGGSYALWQMAEAGAVTLPHIDDDRWGQPLGTYIRMVEGAQLIVAWRQLDLHEDLVLADIQGPYPSLSRLHTVPSLTIVRATAGDLIYMPKDTVHMVITETRKVQLAYHVYE